MGLLEETLKGKSLADYTHSQLKLALGAVLYTNTADMWQKYLNQLGYSGPVAQMLQKYYVDYNIPAVFRNYVNAGAGIFSPQQFFQDGSIGVLYDNNDLSTFFSDSAGTTPAVVNGPVGLQLDKSQGLVLGAEILTNGDFSTDTVWIKGAGWTIGSGVATGASASTDLYTPPSGAYVQGRTYRVQITLATVTSGSLRVWIAGNFGPVLSTAGQHTFNIMADSNNYMSILGSSFVGTIDSVSVKELPGNHRYQATTGFKPILRGTSTGAELFTAYGTLGAGWSVAGATGTATTASSALPTTTAAVVGKHYRVTYTVTRSAGSVQLSFGGRTGVSRSAAGQYVEYFDNALNTNALTATGTGFTGTVRIDEVKDVSAGSVTAPYGLQYDGVDDFMQTASVNFSATDKMFVCAGVRKLSDAAVGFLAELSADAGDNAGAFNLTAPNDSGASGNFGFRTRGSINIAPATTPTTLSPVTVVITGIGNISGDSSIIRVNGIQSPTITSDQGTGNYGAYPIYFGRRGGVLFPFNGLDFGFCIVGKTLTASQIANTERWMAQRTGVTL